MSEDTKPADGNEANAAQSPEHAAQIARLRARVRESFGSVAMTMMLLPQYRNQTVADLQHLVLEPLVQDRISVAYPATQAGETPEPEGGTLKLHPAVSRRLSPEVLEKMGAVRVEGEHAPSGTDERDEE